MTKRVWLGQRLSDGLLFSLALNDIEIFFTCEQLAGIQIHSNHFSLDEQGIEPTNKNKWTSFDIKKIIDVYSHQINIFLDEGLELFPYYIPTESMPSLHYKQSILNEKIFRNQLSRSLQMYLMNQYDVLSPKWIIPYHLSWEEIVNSIGTPFVLQFDNTSSGLGTYLINSKYDYIYFLKRYGNADIATQYISDSYSCSAHIWISPKNIQVTSPSIQLIEKKYLSSDVEIQTFSYRGNDFGLYNTEIGNSEQIKRQLLRIGSLYQNAGIWGLIGVDYIIKDGNFFYNETNFRLQNSTSLLSFLQPPEDNIVTLMLGKEKKIAKVRNGFQYFVSLKVSRVLSGIYLNTVEFISNFNNSRLLDSLDKYLVFASTARNGMQNIRIIGLGKGYIKCECLSPNVSKFIERLVDIYG